MTEKTITTLGKNYTVLYSNNKKLSNDLLIAGKIIDDLCWKMPLSKKINEKLINCNNADICNKNEIFEESSYNACLLSNFTKNTPWANLDISETSISTNNFEEPTARPTKLLIQYIINLSLSLK